MAVYLGSQRVGPNLNTVVTKTITQNAQGLTISQTTSIDNNFINEDPDNLSANGPVINQWTRPSGWPDLDALPALDEGVYLTYDNTSHADIKYASFYCVTNTGKVKVSLGHISGSSFVEDTSWELASATYLEINYSSSAYDYPIFKIVPLSTNHILQLYFARVAAATLGTYAVRQLQDLYCLERKGWLPYLTTTAGSGDNYRFCTEWMEQDQIKFGDAVTSLAAAWYRARHLLKINFLGWTGANCNITSLGSLFEQANEIEEIDLSSWETSNWHITSINNLFYSCFRLKKVDVTWDTSNWGATSNRAITASGMFQYALSIENINLNSWDTSGWNCTTLGSAWYCCYHLKSLKVDKWNTANWHVTNIAGTWYLCRQLTDIDLSGWNTTNWAVTSLYITWSNNTKRRTFDDIKNWNTTNWRVTTMESTFAGCETVTEINLNNWNVSAWKCTNLLGTWNGCQSMRSLKVGNWDMTGTDCWKVTTLYTTFLNCYNLEDTTFLNWHTSNWAVTRVGSTFYGCWKIKELDIAHSNWKYGTFTIADGTSHFNYMCGYCHSLKKVDISNFDVSAVARNNYGSNGTTYTNFYENLMLETLILPSTFAGRLNVRYNYMMSHDELVRLIDALPTALSGATLVITEMRYKLSTAEIAVATNKGYTVS